VSAPPADPAAAPSGPVASTARAPSPIQRLAATPGRFDLDQAVRVAAPAGDALALRYRTVTRLGFPAGEVLAHRPEQRELVIATFGLIGPGGVLPRHHTAMVAAEQRKRSHALHHFVDMLASRFTGLHVLAGARYRPAVDPSAAERVLAAAMGLETPGLMARTGVPRDTTLYHAGHLAARSRSAARLAAMLEEEAGAPVWIEEFAGRWVRLPASERTRLAGGGRGALSEGQHAKLGEGALIGAETWDAQARFVLRIGPLDARRFAMLLPDQPLHGRIAALTRLFVGPDTGFVIAPVLKAQAIGDLRLGAAGGRLGWTSWLSLPRDRTRRQDGTEPRFEPRSQAKRSDA
jgi:type VI secretion system protein ImpH